MTNAWIRKDDDTSLLIKRGSCRGINKIMILLSHSLGLAVKQM